MSGELVLAPGFLATFGQRGCSPETVRRRLQRSNLELDGRLLSRKLRIVAEGCAPAAAPGATSMAGAFFGPVFSRLRASAGPGPRPRQPSIARPVSCGADSGPSLSAMPDRYEVSHPPISKYRRVTAAAAVFFAPVVQSLLASVVPGPRPRRPAIGPPGYCLVSIEWFVPLRSGSRHHRTTLARPSLHVAFIIPERATTAKDLGEGRHHCMSHVLHG